MKKLITNKITPLAGIEPNYVIRHGVCHLNTTTTPTTVNRSINVSSVVDVSVGVFTVNMSRVMNDVNYTTSMSGHRTSTTSGGGTRATSWAKSVTSCDVFCYVHTNNSLSDYSNINFTWVNGL